MNPNTQPHFKLADPQHEAYRQELLARYQSSRGMCGTFTRCFVERFPGLKAVAGYYHSSTGLNRGDHWWLVNEKGETIDPTADQFLDCGAGTLVPYNPHKHLTAKGTCMCCGFSIFMSDKRAACSPECDEELAREYGCRPGGGPYDDDFKDVSTDAQLIALGIRPKKLMELIGNVEVALGIDYGLKLDAAQGVGPTAAAGA